MVRILWGVDFSGDGSFTLPRGSFLTLSSFLISGLHLTFIPVVAVLPVVDAAVFFYVESSTLLVQLHLRVYYFPSFIWF